MSRVACVCGVSRGMARHSLFRLNTTTTATWFGMQVSPPLDALPIAPCTPHTRCRRRSHPRCFCHCRRCRRGLAFVDDADCMCSSKRARHLMSQLRMLQGKCCCKYQLCSARSSHPKRKGASPPELQWSFTLFHVSAPDPWRCHKQ